MLRAPLHDCDGCELGGSRGCVFARKRLPANALLVAQGAVAREVGFVRGGVIALSMVSGDGQQTWGAIRGPHSLLGIEAIHQACSACEVRTLTPVELCAATVPAVTGWLASPGVSRALFDLTVTELLEQQRDVAFRTGNVRARVARFALEFERLIGTQHALRPLSKAKVASLLGIRPETLSRVLGELSAGGCLDSSTGMRVVDRPALETIACQ